jgi:hypothetical protein
LTPGSCSQPVEVVPTGLESRAVASSYHPTLYAPGVVDPGRRKGPVPEHAKPATPPTPQELVQASQQLQAIATQLNAASDQLAKPIAELDGALKKLGLGVTHWVPIGPRADSGNGWVTTNSVGYARIGGNWGIAISVFREHEDSGDFRDDEWLFGQAPRELRVAAVGYLPVLLKELAAKATRLMGDLKAKTEEAQQIARAFVVQKAEQK